MLKIKPKTTWNLNYSPNFYNKKRTKSQVKFIVIHYTGMKSQKKAIKKLTSINSNVSSNYFIDKLGNIIEMVPDEFASWHAGKSNWKHHKNINKLSVGIEVQNPGHEFGYIKYSKNQISSLIELLRYLKKKYNIKNSFILGHSDISPDRKKDPGEKFPWIYLYKNKLAIWHNLKKSKILKYRLIKLDLEKTKNFFKLLKKIGYRSKKKKKICTSFQRRFRPEIVNGIPDIECQLIAKNLINKRI